MSTEESGHVWAAHHLRVPRKAAILGTASGRTVRLDETVTQRDVNARVAVCCEIGSLSSLNEAWQSSSVSVLAARACVMSAPFFAQIGTRMLATFLVACARAECAKTAVGCVAVNGLRLSIY